MSLSRNNVPLGAVLQQAGLVSADRLKEALQQQNKSREKLRIGEILASQGHINPETADFFAERWSTVVQQQPKQPIGQYLKQAALLDEAQIQVILNDQKQSKLKFGELAIAKGWLKQKTIDFFLRYLAPESANQTEAITDNKLENLSKVEYSQRIHEGFYKIKLRLLNLKEQDAYSEEVLERVLYWTGGQSFLTQKLFQLIGEHKDRVVAGKETEQVDYLVQTKLIKNWRTQEIGEHLRTIEDRLLNNQQSEPSKLLSTYQQILTNAHPQAPSFHGRQGGEATSPQRPQKSASPGVSPGVYEGRGGIRGTQTVPQDESPQQQQLLKMGLVVKQQDRLVVANRIYQLVFDPIWVQQKLNDLNRQPNSSIAVVPEKPTALISKSRSKQQRLFQLKNLLLLLTLIALLLVFFNNIFKKIKVRTAFERGNEFLKQKSFEQALTQYNTLLKIDSNYYQAWTNRGYALAGLQEYEEMRESCLTATIIEPTAIYAWNCQGEALHNLQRDPEAIAAFEQAIALDENDPIFLINKSESLKALGEHERSLTTIEEAIQVLKKIEATKGQEKVSGEFAVAFTFLGNGYRRKEQYASAITSYNRALEYSPNYFPAQLGKGIVLDRVQRYPEAIEEFKGILDNQQLSQGRKAQTWFYLGKTLCKTQQKSAGIAAFEQAIELRPDYSAAQQAKEQCS